MNNKEKDTLLIWQALAVILFVVIMVLVVADSIKEQPEVQSGGPYHTPSQGPYGY